MIEIVTTQARRFDDFQSALEANDTDKILIHDGTGTKTITAANFKADLLATLDAMQTTINQLTFPGAGPHNSIFRGKNLGDHVTPEQWAAIADGSFADLYIGDYWVINGVIWRIAAFDYYLWTGDNVGVTAHHVVIVPDTALDIGAMNTTLTTDGGYIGSLMRTMGLEQARTAIGAAFNNHVMVHRQFLSNAVTSGRPSGGAWVDSSIEIMNEVMVYGSAIFSPVSDGTTVPTIYTLGKSQLPLFALRPDLISNRLSYWLRDVVSDTSFAIVADLGTAYCYSASVSLGVRPAFSIVA